ncbi:MAG: hypothetical protein DRR19_01990 [Candidatus Parabeggiatoa sp. nov. 1]|nr:MAG: hypothetical protein DRR19_01990 [Gammaproteobacteria bacterium]
MKKRLRWGSTLIGMTLCIATWQFSQGKGLYFQAWLAQGLLHTAWVRTQASGHQVKPWPWANTWPLARLLVPRLSVKQVVLSHTSDGMSAFALGHLDNSVLPGELGNSVLNVRYGTYFGFLKALELGDMLVLESLRSGRWHYQVSAIYIVDKTDTLLVEPSLNRRLTLVSCYLCTEEKDRRRYVVVADEVETMA